MSEVRRRPEGDTTTEVLASAIRDLGKRLDRIERRRAGRRRNVDGGAAASIFLDVQSISGGGA